MGVVNEQSGRSLKIRARFARILLVRNPGSAPADPTLTVDNVSCVMEKVESDIRYKFGMMFLGSQ